MPDYIRLIERNQNEEETWYFYIPVTDNSTEIKALHDDIQLLIDDGEDCFSINIDKIVPEMIVDYLNNDSENEYPGYMFKHNVLSGKLNWIKGLRDFIRKEPMQEITHALINDPHLWKDVFIEDVSNTAVEYLQIIFHGIIRIFILLYLDGSKLYVQHNGNENSLFSFWNNQKRYIKKVAIDWTIHANVSNAYTLKGNFVYDKLIDDRCSKDKLSYIYKALYKGGIRNFCK